VNKHKMRYSSSYSWHPTNIWNDDLRKKRKAYNEALLRGERVHPPADGTPILRAVLGTAFIAWILLCIHLWFRLP
jgi:hypothetical protein